MSDQAFDLISIGGGSGGLACAQRAAEFGAKAAVIEPHRLGGTCVNVGCVPKKVMWNAASIALGLADASDYGFDVTVAGNDWQALKRKRDAYVLRLNGIYERTLANKGVSLVRGAARFLDKDTVEVNGERLTARHIVIATGGKPVVPNLPGAEHGIVSDGFFSLEQRPARVAIAGSGYVACELARGVPRSGQRGGVVHPQGSFADELRCDAGEILDARNARSGMTIHQHVVPASVREQAGRKTLTAADGREFRASIVCSGRSGALPMWPAST